MEKEYIKSLVTAAKNGNEKCFEELYNIYYEKIYANCLSITKNTTDAEECLQLTFIKAWQNICTIEDRGAFNTWLQKIAFNECYSLLRKRKVNISVDNDEEPFEIADTDEELSLPEVYAEQNDLSDRLKLIIDNLSDVQRQTITLFYFSELSVEEIAEVMSCNESTVKSRLFLARKSIKTEIEEQESRSGQKFYGVAAIPVLPFGSIFTSVVKKTIISPESAARIIKGVTGAASASAKTAAANFAAKTAVKEAAKTTAKAGAKATGSFVTKIVAISAAVVIAIGGGTFGAVKLFGNKFSDKSITDVDKTKLYDAELSTADEEEITRFLNTYCNYKREFYNYNKKDLYEAEALYGIIGNMVSVDYSKYPVIQPKDMTEKESVEFLHKNGYDITGDYLWLIEYDKESVEWIATNIFNFEKGVFTDMVERRIKETLKEQELGGGDIFKAKGSDNRDKYYYLAGGVGGVGVEVEITWARTDGEKYYIKFDESIYGYLDMSYELLNANQFNQSDYLTKYAVMEKKEIDGSEYWTVYQISSDIPENIFTAPAENAMSDVAYTYYDMDGHTELVINNNGTFTAEYSRTSYSDEAGIDIVLQYQKCSGKFSDITKIDKYSFRATISDIKYKEKPGTKKYSYEDGQKTVYSYVPGIEENKTVVFYAKGTRISKLYGECSTSYVLQEKAEASKAEHIYMHIKDSAELYTSNN